MIQKLAQEEKELLLKDLCARLPYGIIIYRISDNSIHNIHSDIAENIDVFSHFLEYSGIDDIRPYLRPMSSMTDDERSKLERILSIEHEDYLLVEEVTVLMNFYNQNHFDYNYLIEKGLALEAPEDMYKRY